MNSMFLNSPLVRFLRHVVEMCMVMCAAAIVLNFAFFQTAWSLGSGDLRESAPIVSSIFLTLSLSLPMVVWMRFRGHSWQPTIEMAASTVGLALVLFVAAAGGLISVASIFDLIARLACPAMIGTMLIRWDLYAGTAVHVHHAM